MLPRGIRNKNPGNIERSWQFEWRGEVRPGHPEWSEAEQEDRFCVFEEPVYGLRAMMKNLITYNKKRNIKTLRQAVERWAPPHENKTDNYTNFVADFADINPDNEWDFTQRIFLIPVVRGMVLMENGRPDEEQRRNGAHKYWYDEKTYNDAYEMAVKGRVTPHTMNEASSKKSPEVFAERVRKPWLKRFIHAIIRIFKGE